MDEREAEGMKLVIAILVVAALMALVFTWWMPDAGEYPRGFDPTVPTPR